MAIVEDAVSPRSIGGTTRALCLEGYSNGTATTRTEAAFAATDRAFHQMAPQEMSLGVGGDGPAEHALQIRHKLAELKSAGDPNAVTTLTNTIADGLGDTLNHLAAEHRLDLTVDPVHRGRGGSAAGGSVSVSPNIRLTLRGDPKHVAVLLDSMSSAMDQSGGTVMRKPTLRELHDAGVVKNKVVTFDTRHLSEAERNAFFGDLSALVDAKGKRFLKGFTETSDGIAIGDHLYGGDMRAALVSNKGTIKEVLARHQVPDYRIDQLILDNFAPETTPSENARKTTPEREFAKAVTDHVLNKIEAAPAFGTAFPQTTDATALLVDRTKRGVEQMAGLKKSAAAALRNKLASDVDAGLLRGDLDVDEARTIKERLLVSTENHLEVP